MHPRDWHLLGCQVKPGAEVYINVVGHVWCRFCLLLLGSRCLGDRASYSVPRSRHSADLAHGGSQRLPLEAGGPSYRFALLSFFVLSSVVGVPLSCNKKSGGDTVVWYGFELLHRTRHLGLFVRRAEWFTKWARETADATFVHMAQFEEVLGRIMFVVGALELQRPFLEPLCRFTTIHPRGSVRRVPPYVKFLLRHLAEQVSRTRHHPRAAERVTEDTAARVDAQASDTRTGIGVWYPRFGKDGRLDLKASPWFVVCLVAVWYCVYDVSGGWRNGAAGLGLGFSEFHCSFLKIFFLF